MMTTEAIATAPAISHSRDLRGESFGSPASDTGGFGALGVFPLVAGAVFFLEAI